MAGTPRAPTEFDVGRLDIVVSRDQIAPSIPGQPAQGALTETTAAITWAASTDTGGSGLKGYDVERNGVVIATDVPVASYADIGLNAGTTYSYRVRARDNAGNVSAFSATRAITTPDTTAPSVAVIAVAALSQTELQVSLVTPSTDTGSGFRDYTLQVSTNGTSGWTDLATALQAGSFPYTHGGLTAGTQRYYRLRAFDNVANSSTSAVVNATTQAQGLLWVDGNDPVITQIALTQNVPYSVNVRDLVTGEQSVEHLSGSVPGLTFNAGTSVLSGTPTTPNLPGEYYEVSFRADDGQGGGDDWATRSAGAVFANRLQDASAISTYGFQDGFQPRMPVLDTVIRPIGASGSARIAIANTDGASSGSLRVPFGLSYSAGQTFWVSYRIYAPAVCAFQQWPTADQTGRKFSIVSNTQQSNMNHELVVQDTDMGARIFGYYQDGNVTAVHASAPVSTPASSSDFIEPAGIDRAVRAHTQGFVTYPLTGNNPDTGAAWSAQDQARARYGLLYSTRVANDDYRRGFGDPISGAMRVWPGEWMTITQRVILGQYGQFNNRWTCWAARDGQPYVLCWDLNNIRVGGDGLTHPYNCLWLLPYVTARTSGGRQVSSRTSNIGGVSILAVGIATPIGEGTLEYNASTQRFRWSGNGQSFGTARGFSVANGKTRLHVIATGNSFLLIEVVNAGQLPSSGTVTDTVTVADGRSDTHVNYADLIVSAGAINAPGGHTPEA